MGGYWITLLSIGMLLIGYGLGRRDGWDKAVLAMAGSADAIGATAKTKVRQ